MKTFLERVSNVTRKYSDGRKANLVIDIDKIEEKTGKDACCLK